MLLQPRLIDQAGNVAHWHKLLLQAPSLHSLRFASRLLGILGKHLVEHCVLYPAGCCPGL